jgi:hypothetical protein
MDIYTFSLHKYLSSTQKDKKKTRGQIISVQAGGYRG